MTSYFMRDLASDLTGSLVGSWSDNRPDNQYREDTAAPASFTFPEFPAGATQAKYGFTEPGVPGVLGVTGDYTLKLEILTGSSDISVYPSLYRVSESNTTHSEFHGTAQETPATAGVKTFSFSNVDLGTWRSIDRLCVRWRFTNNHMMSDLTCEFALNTVDTEITTPFLADPVYGYFDLDDDVDLEWVGSRPSVGAFDLDDEVELEWSGFAPVPEVNLVEFQDRTATRTRSFIRVLYIASPSGLTVWVVSGTELGVSWDPVPAASAYDLRRDGEIILYGYELTEYLDEGLEVDGTYTYQVRSVL